MEIDRGFLGRLLADDLKSMGFDQESGDEVVEALCEATLEYLPELRRAVAGAAGMSEISFFAHALKGTFNNFSAPQFISLADLFQTMEKEAKTTGSLEVVTDLMTQVEGELKVWIN
ncbi:MAG: Hpt domain-containing protein [Pseudomonadota bacterium]|nr:Hpt domain-containing protein [Pseudomonadota bacterium]